MAEKSKKTDFPSELVGPIKNFQDSLNKIDKTFAPLLSTTNQELVEKKNLDALSKAKLDCTSAFTINSLVWMWLRTRGENPKEAGVPNELERVKKSMVRLKELQEKAKRVPVDGKAAKRLVKGSLWEPKDSQKRSKNSSHFDGNAKKSKKH